MGPHLWFFADFFTYMLFFSVLSWIEVTMPLDSTAACCKMLHNDVKNVHFFYIAQQYIATSDINKRQSSK